MELKQLTGAHYHHLCRIIEKMNVDIPDSESMSENQFAMKLTFNLIGSMYKAEKEFDALLIELTGVNKQEFEKFKTENGEEYFSLCQDIIQKKAFVKLFQLAAN